MKSCNIDGLVKKMRKRAGNPDSYALFSDMFCLYTSSSGPVSTESPHTKA